MNRPSLHHRLAQQTPPRKPALPANASEQPTQDFGGHDYLGLARHFQVLGALQDSCARQGLQGGGRQPVHERLEQEVAQWLGFPAARCFQNMGQARQAIQQALLSDEQDVCVQDYLNAPALIDATRLAGCRLRHYPHRDAEGAAWQLRQSPHGLAVLVSEGLFEADGHPAPLRTLALVAERHQAHLLVDDMHAIGVCGESGGGSVEQAGLPPSAVTALVISLEHAFGLQGAMVLADDGLIQHLDHLAGARGLPRPATAVAAAALVSVQLARRDQWRRHRLLELSQQLHLRLRSHGLQIATPHGPLQCIDLEGTAEHWQAALIRRGARVPSLPLADGDNGPRTRLRIHLSALQEPAQLDALVDSIARLNDSSRLSVPLLLPVGA